MSADDVEVTLYASSEVMAQIMREEFPGVEVKLSRRDYSIPESGQTLDTLNKEVRG